MISTASSVQSTPRLFSAASGSVGDQTIYPGRSQVSLQHVSSQIDSSSFRINRSASVDSFPSARAVTETVGSDFPIAQLSPVSLRTLAERTATARPPQDDVSEAESTRAAKDSEKDLEKEVKDRQFAADQRTILALAARDREVRAHERAHAAAGGQFAGSPSYQYQRGPDGVNYAVGGEVPIDVGKAASPEATLIKAQTVRRAALAPANPSAQDRAVAAQASRLEAEARLELNAQQTRESADSADENATVASNTLGPGQDNGDGDSVGAPVPNSAPGSGEDPQNPLSSRTRFLLDQTIANVAIDPAQPGDLLSQTI